MFGVARWSAAKAITERSLALPPLFLCPTLASRRSSDRGSVRSTRASSSSAPLRPTKPRRGNSVGQQNGAVVVSGGQNDPEDGFAAQTQSRMRRPQITSMKPRTFKVRESPYEQQEILLTRLAVKDIAQSSPAFSLPSDDLHILQQAEDRYFELCGADSEAIGQILAELAMAYIHVGHSKEAVRLLERHRRRCEETGQSAPLLPWRPVFSAAYALQDYDLAVRLVRAGSDGSNATDDWLMVARLQAQLRLLPRSVNLTIGSLNVHTDRFWQEFSNIGRRAPDEIFTILIKSQIERGRIDLIEQTLLARKEHGYNDNQNIWRALLFLHPKGRKRAVFRHLPTKLGLDGGQIFEQLIRDLADPGDFRRIVLAFRLFGVESGMPAWRPTFTTFSTIMHRLCAMGKPDTAMRYLSVAVTFGIRDDEMASYARVCSRIMDVFAQKGQIEKGIDLALQVTGIERQSNDISICENVNGERISPNVSQVCLTNLPCVRGVNVYNSALRLCGRLDDPLDAVTLARQFLLSKFRRTGPHSSKQMSDAIVRVLQRVYSTAKWKDMASALGKIADDAEKVPPIFAAELHSFIESLRAHGFVDHFIIKTRFYRPEPSRDAQESLDWMTKPFRNANPFVTHSDPETTNVREDDQTNLFEGLKFDTDPEIHLTPEMTSMGYSLRLRVFAVVRQDHESAVVVYRHMVERGVKPTSQHIAPIVEGLVLNGRVRDAIALRNGARKTISDVESSMRIAVALVRGHARLNDWPAVREELMRMRRQGIEPNASMWAAVADVQSKLWGQRQPLQTSLGDEAKDVMKRLSDAQKMLRENVEEQKHSWSDVDNIARAGKKPSLTFVVPKYRAMFNQRMFSLALAFMAQALDAGLRPDRLLHVHLVKNFHYLRKQAEKDEVNVEDALRAQAPLYRIPLDCVEAAAAEDEGADSAKEALSRKSRMQGKAMHWAPLLQRARSNMDRTRSLHPHNAAVRQRDGEARRAMLQLIFDMFASRRLFEEAQTLNQEEKEEENRNPGV